LQLTPEQLPELAEAGVVDAGGRGLVLVLDELAAAGTGSGVDLTPVRLPEPDAVHHLEAATAHFEVQYLLEAPRHAVDRLRSELAGIGDSVAVVGAGRDAWKVHAHVSDVGAAIEAGLEAGRPHQISVVQLDGPLAVEPLRAGARALIAFVSGGQLAQLFEREGVQVVPPAAPGEELLAAVTEDTRELVMFVPTEAAGAADAAAAQLRRRDVQVSVVPVRSPVQGLAAVAVHDPTRRFEDDVVAMAEAAAATRFAEVTIAETAGLTAVGLCQPGDVLGLIDGEVVVVGRSVLAVAFDVIDRLLGIGAELVTVLTGAGLPAQAGALLESHVRNRAPLTDVAVYVGGQPDHPVIIGAE
jgi:dihydroxyacetone kinase-like predicted kinase